jgi:hypothetical protein
MATATQLVKSKAPVIDIAVVKQYQRWLEADAQAHALWKKVDREMAKLVRVAKIGRKGSITVPISESRAIEIVNQFRGVEKVFAPAFARKYKVRELDTPE